MREVFGCPRSGRSVTNSRLVALVIASSLVAVLSGCATPALTRSPAALSRVVQPPRVSAARLARLPGATTFGRLHGAPLDPAPFSPETGVVIHPTAARAVYAYPGGPPVAVLPATELSSPTWVPVVQTWFG